MPKERKLFPDDYLDSLSPKDIQEILCIGRRQTYELFQQEPAPFHFIRLGRKIIVPKTKFIEWYYGGKND